MFYLDISERHSLHSTLFYDFSKFVGETVVRLDGEEEENATGKLRKFKVRVVTLERLCAEERHPSLKRPRCRSVDFIAQEIPVRGTSIRGSVLYFTCRDMRRALLHRVHARSPAFNHATYAEIKYSIARTPGRTARPRDPQLGWRWIVATQALASKFQSKLEFFQRSNFSNQDYANWKILHLESCKGNSNVPKKIFPTKIVKLYTWMVFTD